MLWPFKPDWSSPVVHTYSYRTDVFQARSGREQRRALRNNPRFTAEFSVHTGVGFEALLRSRQNRPFVLPDPTEKVGVTGLTAGGFTVASVPRWLRVGAIVVSGASYATVTAVVGNTITADIVVEDVVYLGRRGYVTSSGASETNGLTIAKVRFEAIPDDLSRLRTTPPEMLYRGRELFLKTPNMAYRVQDTHAWSPEHIDYQRGATAQYTPTKFGHRTSRMTFTFKKPEVDDLLMFHNRMLGMRGEFYAPTWRQDMTLAGSIHYGSQAVAVLGDEVYRYLNGSRSRQDIMLRLYDGRVFYRQVEFVSLASGNSVLNLTEPLPAIAVGDVRLFCWVQSCTLGEDALKVAWLTDDYAKVDVSIRTIDAPDYVLLNSPPYAIIAADSADVSGSFVESTLEGVFVNADAGLESADVGGSVELLSLTPAAYYELVESADVGGSVQMLSLRPAARYEFVEAADVGGSVQALLLKPAVLYDIPVEAADVGGSVQALLLKPAVLYDIPVEAADVGGSVRSVILERV